MIGFKKRRVVTTRLEWVLDARPGGYDWVDIDKAIAQARQALALTGRDVYDNSIRVAPGDDDQIVVSIEYQRPEWLDGGPLGLGDNVVDAVVEIARWQDTLSATTPVLDPQATRTFVRVVLNAYWQHIDPAFAGERGVVSLDLDDSDQLGRVATLVDWTGAGPEVLPMLSPTERVHTVRAVLAAYLRSRDPAVADVHRRFELKNYRPEDSKHAAVITCTGCGAYSEGVEDGLREWADDHYRYHGGAGPIVVDE